MKVIYLACGRARLKYKNVVYNDIVEDSDLKCDMMDVDLSQYDFILASPPCNYYSRCNYRAESSAYAQKTKHLLPSIIKKCLLLNKPFVIENVRSPKKFKMIGLFDLPIFIYFHGRHTYFTNIMIDFRHIPQTFDFYSLNGHCARKKSYVQGGDNVNNVFDYILENYGNETTTLINKL